MSLMNSTHKGFTLIELLVVISIIGLLSSIVLASLNAARSKSRDSQRKQDLIQLRNALELYYSVNNRYPIVSTGYAGAADAVVCNTTTNTWYNASFSGQNNWIPGLVPNFISRLPADPKSNGCNQYLYRSNAAGSDYKIYAYLTVEEGVVAQGKPWARIASNCTPPVQAWWNTNTYAIYNRNSGAADNSGPECW